MPTVKMPKSEDIQQLIDAPEVMVGFSGLDMLELLGAMQSVLRYPELLTSAAAKAARAFAEALEERIGTIAPGMKEVCGAGWNPDAELDYSGRTYEIGSKPSFTGAGCEVSYIRCLICGRVSFSVDDIKHRYCGSCKTFHEAPGAV
jgi:hypothetical protein